MLIKINNSFKIFRCMNKILTYLLVLYFKRNSCYFTVYKNDYFWAKEKFITFLRKLRGIRVNKQCLNKVSAYVPRKIFSMPFNFNLISTILHRETFSLSSNRFVFKLTSSKECFYFIFQYYPKLGPITNIQHHKKPCYNLITIGCLK